MNRRRLAIVPWRQPTEDLLAWSPFTGLQKQVNSLFDDFLTGFSDASPRVKNFSPSVTLSEDDENIYIDAELAGMSDKDVELTLTKEAVTLRGEKKSKTENRSEKGRYYSEQSYGFFERTIPLHTEIDEDKADAEFKDGVLHIKLRKSKAAQSASKQIPIRPAA